MAVKAGMLLCLALLAVADGASAEPKLRIGTVADALIGGSATLPILLEDGDADYGGFNAKIQLPPGVTVTDVAPGALLSQGFILDYNARPAAQGSTLAIVAYSSRALFSASSGLFFRTEPGAVLCGDADASASVDVSDAYWVARYTIDLEPTPFDLQAADVDGDGSVSVGDALAIARWTVDLPVTGTCLGAAGP
jgi:hypothetical protein